MKMETAPNVRIIPVMQQAVDGKSKSRRLNVAAYCRVSTEQEEQQNSYQVQIEYYTSYISSNPEWSFAGIFADEGISGTQTKNRTEFNRMIRMCKKKKIDLVLCKSTSRFARNTVDCLEYIRLLKSLGIGVIFEKENINTLTAQSEFILALYSSFAQAESESISKNITLGNQMAFKEGKVRYQYKHWLGYKKGEDGKPQIIPEEAEAVKTVFRLFLEGKSYNGIVKYMNDNNYVNRSSTGQWVSSMVKRILENEKYIGDSILQKTFTVDCITHKTVRNKGERPMYYVSDCHPAIIDKDTFHRVQQEIARRNSKRSASTKNPTEQSKYSSKYALTELLICGECGTACRRCRWTSHNRDRTVWRCINRLEHGPKYCKSPAIDEQPLHNAIVRAINEFYNCSDDVANVLKTATDSVLSRANGSEIRQIEQRLKDIDNARNELINLIATGTCAADSLDNEFAKLFEEEEQLSQTLISLKSQADSEQNNLAEEVKAEIDNTSFQLDEYDDVLVRKVVECIKVLSIEEIAVTFKGGYEIKSKL
ncbi:MAG: recombinase family protein [Lachnospiraceae bacterium]|nr:recombinase family protein [Lachnospiraceae bacterium]